MWQFVPWVIPEFSYTICEPDEEGNISPACLDDAWRGDGDWALDMVDRYISGERGSCAGFLYYDSIVGGPSQCVIEHDLLEDFIEFHSGWGSSETLYAPTPHVWLDTEGE